MIFYNTNRPDQEGDTDSSPVSSASSSAADSAQLTDKDLPHRDSQPDSGDRPEQERNTMNQQKKDFATSDSDAKVQADHISPTQADSDNRSADSSAPGVTDQGVETAINPASYTPRPLPNSGKQSGAASSVSAGASVRIPTSQPYPAAGATNPYLTGSDGDAPSKNAVKAANGEVAGQEYQPMQVRLVLSRVEPWTVMKVTFLLSVCFGIAMILAGILVWLLLNSMHVFSAVENFVNSIDPSGAVAQLVDYVRLPRVVAITTILAVANVILMTAFATVGALLYNLSAALVGGIRLALTDD